MDGTHSTSLVNVKPTKLCCAPPTEYAIHQSLVATLDESRTHYPNSALQILPCKMSGSFGVCSPHHDQNFESAHGVPWLPPQNKRFSGAKEKMLRGPDASGACREPSPALIPPSRRFPATRGDFPAEWRTSRHVPHSHVSRPARGEEASQINARAAGLFVSDS